MKFIKMIYFRVLKVQHTVIFIEMMYFPCFKGAAHHDIKFNVTVRCTKMLISKPWRIRPNKGQN
jgi:hypothetical protein